MKKFIISESELTKIIQKSIEKQLNEDNFTEEVIEGAISKDELHKHFDEDGDGTVTPDEYDDHIRKHIRKELKK
jgi:hypothetical protein